MSRFHAIKAAALLSLSMAASVALAESLADLSNQEASSSTTWWCR